MFTGSSDNKKKAGAGGGTTTRKQRKKQKNETTRRNDRVFRHQEHQKRVPGLKKQIKKASLASNGGYFKVIRPISPRGQPVSCILAYFSPQTNFGSILE